MGDERFKRYLESFEEPVPVSIRLNPKQAQGHQVVDGEPVGWCPNGYYLKTRPNFTMDPLLHAGCYYVQEAASMFLDEILRQVPVGHCRTALDLCAAPGGKSTLLRSVLPADCVLFSNEPIRSRASILLENVQKWGYDNHYVTNVYPETYRKSKLKFDLILCDVPCSGEGMFRKDEATIREWSPQHVEKCRQLQRDIVADAWSCLNVGGLLIYSTCTFNIKENEENVRWMLGEFDDAAIVPINTKPEWQITGSLLEGFHEPVYRFIPGITRGEGLFMCVLRKGQEQAVHTEETGNPRKKNKKSADGGPQLPILERMPLHTDGPIVELSYSQAIAFLRHEALVLPADTPRGMVEVSFMGHPLGMMKNIGTRANNLYPKEWKIKTTHTLSDYEAILRHT